MDLVVTASKAMSLGVTHDSGKMANLLEIARNKARLFGVDTSQAFNDIVTGIGRGSPLILDNLGIRIPAGFEKMTEGMTATEKTAKLLDLTLEEGNKQLEAMGGLSNTSADQMRAFEAAVSDLKQEVGYLTSEAFLPFAESLRIDILPLVRDFVKEVKLAKEVLDVPGQIAATLYYDSDMKKYPENLEEAQNKLNTTREEIARLSQKLAKYPSSIAAYLGLDKKIAELKKYADQLELLVVGLDAARDKASEKFEDPGFIEWADEMDSLLSDFDVLDSSLEKNATKVQKNKGAIKDLTSTYKTLGESASKDIDLIGDSFDDFGDDLENILGEFEDATKDIANIRKDMQKALEEEILQNYKDLKNLSSNDAQWGMFNFMTGGLINAGTDGEALLEFQEKDQKKFEKTLAEAISQGFANVDLTDIAMSFGNVLSQVLSKSISQSKPILNAGGGINWGNLGLNIGADLAIKTLTRPGRFFGGTEVHGEDQIGLATSMQDRLINDWKQIGEYVTNPLLYSNEELIKRLDTLNHMTMGYFTYQGNNSGDGIFSDKTITYEMLDRGGSENIKKLEEFMDIARSKMAETAYNLQGLQASGSGQYYQNLLSWYEKPLYEAKRTAGNNADSAEKYYDIQTEYDSLRRDFDAFKAARGDRGFALAMEYGGYVEGMTDSLGSNDTLRLRDWYGSPVGQKSILNLDSYAGAPQPMMDRIDLKNQKDFDLAALSITDPEAYIDAYSEYLSGQMEKFEQLSEYESNLIDDYTRSVEERESAIERYNQAQKSYFQAKLDQLKIEQRQEEEQKRLMAEQSQARLEDAMNWVGEFAQNDTKVILVQPRDSKAVLEELMKRFKDNPAMMTVLQGLVAEAEAKALWS